MIVPLCMSTLLASLLGSFHCAGMCGVFAAVATCKPEASGGERAMLMAAYSGGRWVSYATLGAASGMVGEALNLSGNLAGVGNAAIIVAASAVGVAGFVNFLCWCGVALPRLPVPPALLRLATSGHRRVNAWSPLSRAVAIGLLTTLLPCHWLYTFVATAAGTANPVHGALVMSFFWLGTLPVLVVAGTSITKCLGPLRRYTPALTSLLMVAAAAFTIFLRAGHASHHAAFGHADRAAQVEAFCNGAPRP